MTTMFARTRPLHWSAIAPVILLAGACATDAGSPSTSATGGAASGNENAGNAGTASAGASPGDGGAVQGGSGAADAGSGETQYSSRIALGTQFGCAIRTDATIACWGMALADGAETTPPTGQFAALTANTDITCGLLATGTVACWGNLSGAQAVPIPGALSATSIAVGVSEQCAVAAQSGALVCWGGAGALTGTPPTGRFLQVGVGRNFACALTTDGALECWGDNSYGQITPPAGKFVQLVVGSYHSCALEDDGTAHCWGLGNASMPTDGVPLVAGVESVEPWGQAIAPPGTQFKRLAVGALHSCGILKKTGAVQCWGAGKTAGACATIDTCGQAVAHTGPFTDLALGYSNSCGILETGKIECWGSNSGGRSTPPLSFQ